MGKRRQGSKKQGKRRRINVDALMIWIVLEAFVLIAMASLIFMRQMYGVSFGTAQTYTSALGNETGIQVRDIELPTDLMQEDRAGSKAPSTDAGKGN